MAHTALREIVERAVEEARKLPGLGGSGVSGNVPEARNVAEDSYEDILATAILNKVTNIHFSESDLSRGAFPRGVWAPFMEFLVFARGSSERG